MPKDKTLEIDGQEVTFSLASPPALGLSQPPRGQSGECAIVARTGDGAFTVATAGGRVLIDDFDDATLERLYRAALAGGPRILRWDVGFDRAEERAWRNAWREAR